MTEIIRFIDGNKHMTRFLRLPCIPPEAYKVVKNRDEQIRVYLFRR